MSIKIKMCTYDEFLLKSDPTAHIEPQVDYLRRENSVVVKVIFIWVKIIAIRSVLLRCTESCSLTQNTLKNATRSKMLPPRSRTPSNSLLGHCQKFRSFLTIRKDVIISREESRPTSDNAGIPSSPDLPTSLCL